MGFFARVFAKANEINGFALVSRNRSDLASSNPRGRFRPSAGIGRFLYFQGIEMALDAEDDESVLRENRAVVMSRAG